MGQGTGYSRDGSVPWARPAHCHRAGEWVEQEAHELRQQVKRLKEENDILKKAARYFAANPS